MVLVVLVMAVVVVVVGLVLLGLLGELLGKLPTAGSGQVAILPVSYTQLDVYKRQIWRDAAENVAESLSRGTRVIVSGRLKSRSYETKEGEKRTVVEMEVDEVGPSLRYATAKVNRTQRGGGQGGFGGQGGQGGQGGYGGSAPADDPWASGPSAAPSQTPRPAADSGWGGAPSYDEPPF